MSRPVRLATCQPPAPREGRSQEEIEQRALALLEQAGREGADIACLPEALNAASVDPAATSAELSASADRVLDAAAQTCRCHDMCAVVPLIRTEEGKLRNTACILDRRGDIVGVFDKVHVTATERTQHGICAGDDYPVFDLDFGRVGVMICYDGCFPEPARILALQGAEVVLFPALQRGWTETQLDLQVRARALDNFIYVVRSSYGTDPTEAWRAGMMVGKSCIVGPDGTILADLGRFTGVATREVDLDLPERGERTFGGEVGVIRDMRMADRRPETYGRLCR